MDRVTSEDKALFKYFIDKGDLDNAFKVAFTIGQIIKLKENMGLYESEE